MMKILICIIFFSIVCVYVCVYLCVVCMHFGVCLEVREQSLASALAFHLLWNKVSSFLLPQTAHELALWLLGILPSLTPISLEECWSIGSTGHANMGLFPGLVGIQAEVLMRAQQVPYLLRLLLDLDYVIVSSLRSQLGVCTQSKRQDLIIDYKCQSLTQQALSDRIQAFYWIGKRQDLLTFKTAIPPHLLRKKKVAGAP